MDRLRRMHAPGGRRATASSPHTDGRALAAMTVRWLLMSVVLAVAAIALLHAA